MLALTRREGGSSELFAMMAEDIVDLVDGLLGRGRGRRVAEFS